MTKQLSFMKSMHEILPHFRRRLNNAESTEDVKKFFTYTIMELFEKILPDQNLLTYEDIDLLPGNVPPYTLSDRIINRYEVSQALETSDLKDILHKLAETASKRYIHLEKNPEKTESKIRL